MASVIAISGIVLVALPTGVVSSGFMEEIGGKTEVVCPECGHAIASNAGERG